MNKIIIAISAVVLAAAGVGGTVAIANNVLSSSADVNEKIPSDSGSWNIIDDTSTLSLEVAPNKIKTTEKELTVIIHNSEDTIFEYGLDYTMEHYDSEWKLVPFVEGKIFLTVSYTGKDGTKQNISLSDHNFKFVPGNYRISKKIMDKTIYANFEMVK